MPTQIFDVSSESSWNAALSSIDVGGTLAAPNASYTIDLTAGFTETADPLAVNLDPGSSLTVAGAGNTIEGAGYRGLFVYAGTLTLANLTLDGMAAVGGAGA